MNLGLGSHVKEIRSEKKITLKELSDATGLSTSFLSQFERGMSTIAIDSLMSVAEALDVDIHELIDATTPSQHIKDKVVLRSYQRDDVQIVSEHQIQTTLSAYSQDKGMLSRKITLLPNNSEEAPASYKHDGEEFIYVIEGILTLEIDKEKWNLYPGDTAHFASTTNHIWYNETNRNVEFIIVNTPNSYEKSL